MVPSFHVISFQILVPGQRQSLPLQRFDIPRRNRAVQKHRLRPPDSFHVEEPAFPGLRCGQYQSRLYSHPLPLEHLAGHNFYLCVLRLARDLYARPVRDAGRHHDAALEKILNLSFTLARVARCRCSEAPAAAFRTLFAISIYSSPAALRTGLAAHAHPYARRALFFVKHHR